MNKALAELVKISNTVGKKSSLVLGGFGNTSVKTADGRYMYIKASGTALKDMSEQFGWRQLKIEPVLAILKDKSIPAMSSDKRQAKVISNLLLACDDGFEPDIKPSIESCFHSILDRCVIHVHPSALLAYLCAKNGQAELEKIFKNEKFPPMWVPYVGIGYALAKKIEKLATDYKKRYGKSPAVIFLQNHGLLVTANSSNTALRLVRNVVNTCNNGLRRRQKTKPVKIKTPGTETIIEAASAIRRAFFQVTGRYMMVKHFTDKTIAGFMAGKNAGRLCSVPAVTPDELVYSHGPAMWLDEWKPKTILNKLNRKITTGRELPVGFLIKPLGLFIADDKNQAVFLRDVIKTYLSVRSFAEWFGGIHPLNKQQRESTTEAESSNVGGYLKNRIALVTGAGSGLGRSISVGLARAGAAVGLLDIDSKTAEETSALIKKELPDSLTIAIGCDVTSESDIDAAFETMLKNWGGLDILVNAAGVAPAAPLVDMAVDKWRFALEVNLTGYFLMARAAARIMIRQGIGSSIINISSKSGLDASKNNTAYNTTKAGELHMARGWALELGEYGIRVNCICPGNVFEGSKIWNRQYIKECAKKHGIKPEEVIPYYISKTSLKREIKGQDIADAVVFLCSDKACTITGQILVADAGQVMVR